MKAVSEWIWIIGGIIAGLVVFSVVEYQIYQLNLAAAEQRSLEQFSKIKNIINNLCWSFVGNVREYTLSLSETVDGIYAAKDKYTEFKKEELVDNILKNKLSEGNWLCVKVGRKRLRCEELECNVSIPFVGSVPIEFSLSALINQLIGRERTFNYHLRFVRDEAKVSVSTEGLVTTTTTSTTTSTTTTSTTTTTLPFLLCDLNEIMSLIDEDATYSYESHIASKPRPSEGWGIDTSWNKQTRDYIKQQLESLGLENIRVEEFYYQDNTGQVYAGYNVIGEVGSGSNKIVIGGHRDSIPESPGAIDNAAGTSTVIEIARVYALKCKEYITSKNYKLIFVLFDSEEQGLLGSRAFVNKHSTADVKYMLNFDCPSGYKLDVKLCNWVTDETLSNAVDECCKDYNLPCEKTFSNFCGYDCSDYAPFEARGIKHMFTVDLTQSGKCSETLTAKCAPGVIHTPSDNLDVVKKDKLVWASKLGACVLRKLLP